MPRFEKCPYECGGEILETSISEYLALPNKTKYFECPVCHKALRVYEDNGEYRVAAYVNILDECFRKAPIIDALTGELVKA